MATYPKAELKLITPGSRDPRIIPIGMVLHIAATEANSLYGYFNGPSGGIESHVYVRYDGTVEQYRDFDFEADAQSGGNSWDVGNKTYGLISVETQGLGAGTWTDAQVKTLIELISWCAKRYGFPVQKIRSARPSLMADGGIGWHALYSEWNPLKKTCPGNDRIAQIPEIIKKARGTAVASPLIRELINELQDIDSPLSRALRNNYRLATQAELKDEREGKNP